MMYRSLIFFASIFLAAASLAATRTFAEPKESRDGKAPRQRVTKPADRPVAKPRQSTSCAEYGAGFVRAPGSDTCVHLGGGIDVGVGIGR